jgi:hypothetical protein
MRMCSRPIQWASTAYVHACKRLLARQLLRHQQLLATNTLLLTTYRKSCEAVADDLPVCRLQGFAQQPQALQTVA